MTLERSGLLAVSLPLIDVGEPLVALTAFGERLGNFTVAMSTGLAPSGGIITGGVVLLDRSPVVQTAQTRLVPSVAATRGPS